MLETGKPIYPLRERERERERKRGERLSKPAQTDKYREHSMIRFVSGIPKYIWLSQHSNGEAYTFSCLQKDPTCKRVIPTLRHTSLPKLRN
jgi:hypothetical protein